MRVLSVFFVFLLISVANVFAQGKFVGELQLKDVASKYINSGKYDPGWTEFELTKPYSYKDRRGKVWTVPAGTVVNGASIPQAVWSGIGGPWSGKYRNAAVLHDYMVEERIKSSDFVHRVFFEAMEDSGVGWTLRQTIYLAVKSFGPQWEDASGFIQPQIVRPEFDQKKFNELLKKVNKRKMTVDEIDSVLEK